MIDCDCYVSGILCFQYFFFLFPWTQLTAFLANIHFTLETKTWDRTIMPPKKQQQAQAMPSMKELQDLLAQLDAEGGLAIGGGEGAGE